MKRMSGGSGGGRSIGHSNSSPKAGRPGGEVSYSGKKLMARYSKSNTSGGLSMKLSGRAARSNGMKNLAGRASGKTLVFDPNVRHKSN
jgi:hypothetical protein